MHAYHLLTRDVSQVPVCDAEHPARRGQGTCSELTAIGFALGSLTGGRRGRGRGAAAVAVAEAKPRRTRKPITDPEVLARRSAALANVRADPDAAVGGRSRGPYVPPAMTTPCAAGRCSLNDDAPGDPHWNHPLALFANASDLFDVAAPRASSLTTTKDAFNPNFLSHTGHV